jgi:hypothetical protein
MVYVMYIVFPSNLIVRFPIAVSFYVLKTEKKAATPFVFNPFKKQKKEMEKNLDDLADEEIQKFEHLVHDFVTYDAENCLALQHFEPLKQRSQCTFAKKSKVWGSRDWQEDLSLGKLGIRRHSEASRFLHLRPCMCSLKPHQLALE